jgi:hypothetical protein
LMMVAIGAESRPMQFFNRKVGIGSKEHDFDGANLTSLMTSSEDTLQKLQSLARPLEIRRGDDAARPKEA